MGMQLPGELVVLLNGLGYTYPAADETKLFELGQKWIDFTGTVDQIKADADVGARTVWDNNSGEDITAFQTQWNAADNPADALSASTTGTTVVGIATILCGGIVLALKIATIVQLVILAIQIAIAIAQAFVTFGASLLQIPIFKVITGKLIDLGIDRAVAVVLG